MNLCFLYYDSSLIKYYALLDFQIEIEINFYLVRIFTNLRRSHLQSNELCKLIFVNKI
jgi:hypothetical protein